MEDALNQGKLARLFDGSRRRQGRVSRQARPGQASFIPRCAPSRYLRIRLILSTASSLKSKRVAFETVLPPAVPLPTPGRTVTIPTPSTECEPHLESSSTA